MNLDDGHETCGPAAEVQPKMQGAAVVQQEVDNSIQWFLDFRWLKRNFFDWFFYNSVSINQNFDKQCSVNITLSFAE